LVDGNQFMTDIVEETYRQWTHGKYELQARVRVYEKVRGILMR